MWALKLNLRDYVSLNTLNTFKSGPHGISSRSPGVREGSPAGNQRERFVKYGGGRGGSERVCDWWIVGIGESLKMTMRRMKDAVNRKKSDCDDEMNDAADAID